MVELRDLASERLAYHYYSPQVQFLFSLQFTLQLILGLILLWAGWNYKDGPCSQPLPTWLIVQGFLIIGALFFSSIAIAAASGDNAASLMFICMLPCALCFFCIAIPLTFAWFIWGNVLVFSTTPAECIEPVYSLSFWYIIANYLVLLFNCCFGMMNSTYYSESNENYSRTVRRQPEETEGTKPLIERESLASSQAAETRVEERSIPITATGSSEQQGYQQSAGMPSTPTEPHV